MAKTQVLQCALPQYQTDRKKWRRGILERAREALDGRGRVWADTGPFEVIVLLYLSPGKQFEKHDVDNRLKDVLDALQGAFFAKKHGKARHRQRLIRNDSSVCRVVVEKQSVPKKYKNRPAVAPGGRLIVRPYVKGRWRVGLRPSV
jgi:Holliday junction resolvase RusA-like endonuclease